MQHQEIYIFLIGSMKYTRSGTIQVLDFSTLVDDAWFEVELKTIHVYSLFLPKWIPLEPNLSLSLSLSAFPFTLRG